MRIEPVFLFDLDGTLVDSVYEHVLAWKEALDSEGIELSVWRIHRKIGMSGGLFTNQLLREHLRQKRGGYRIEEEDHPKKMPFSTAQLLRRAEHAGAPIGKFCQLIYQQQGEMGIRRILGVLSLMKKYGAAAVEDACATAMDISVHEYRFVRRYLERRPHPQMFLRQIDPLIRQLTEYRDFINLKTKEQAE